MKGVTWKLPLEKQAKLMEQFGEAVEVLEGRAYPVTIRR
jgi:hypothetical protein